MKDEKIVFIRFTINLIIIIMVAVALLVATDSQPVFRSKNTNALALKYDVYPGDINIEKLLSILDNKDCRITFFVSGLWADQNPDICKRIIQEGHEIGCLGYNGVSYGDMDVDETRTDIEKGYAAIFENSGVKPDLLCPPKGDYNDDVLKYASSLGLRVILWSIDTIERADERTVDVAQNILKNAENGDIVYVYSSRESINALSGIIDGIRAKDMNIMPINRLLQMKSKATEGNLKGVLHAL